VRLFACAHTACGVVGSQEIAVIRHRPVHVRCANHAAPNGDSGDSIDLNRALTPAETQKHDVVSGAKSCTVLGGFDVACSSAAFLGVGLRPHAQ
jgi:hypothetical protein